MASFPPPARPSTTSRETRVAAAELGHVIEFPQTREFLSPELVLVDTDLAVSARARLHEPGAFRPAAPTTITRARHQAPVGTVASPPTPAVVPVGSPPAPPPAAVATPRSAPMWRHNVARLALVTLGLFAAAAALSGTLTSSGTTGADDTLAAPAPVIGTPLTSGTASTAPRAAAPAPLQPQAPLSAARQPARTFAWAPVQNARAYEVQIFRGPRLVLVSRTKQPRLTLRPAWRYQGVSFKITPGAYRWYVWTVDAGGAKARKPVVQAKLMIAPLR